MKKGKNGLISSFRYAFCGLFYAVKTQRNMRIHVSVAVLTAIFGLLYRLTPLEWIALSCTITFVIVCEMINTAIESCADAATQDYNAYAKIAKDVAAGAVVVAALLAVVVAAFLFLDPARLFPAFHTLLSNPYYTVGVAALTLLLFWWVLRTKPNAKQQNEDKE